MFRVAGIKLSTSFLSTLSESLQNVYKRDKVYLGAFEHIGLINLGDNTIIPKEYMQSCKYIITNTEDRKSKTFSFTELESFVKSYQVAGVVLDNSGSIVNIFAVNKVIYEKYYFEVLDYKDGIFIVQSSFNVSRDNSSIFNYRNNTYFVSDFDFCILRDILLEFSWLDISCFTSYLYRYKIDYNDLNRLYKFCRFELGLNLVKEISSNSVILSSEDCHLILDEPMLQNMYDNYFDKDGTPLFSIVVGAEFYNFENIKATITDVSASGKQCSVMFADGFIRKNLVVNQLYKLSSNVVDYMTVDSDTVYNGFQYRCICKKCGASRIASKASAFNHFKNCNGTGSHNTVSLSHKVDAEIYNCRRRAQVKEISLYDLQHNNYLICLDISMKKLIDEDILNRRREQELRRDIYSDVSMKKLIDEDILNRGSEQELRRDINSDVSTCDIAKFFRDYFSNK